ncbi:rhomboid family intramembrane serine protease [Polluticoccus soli]|uniref:rhomboid family intramembrane serine protease n=1 Tax=Polluticoccus soli TaxID=3034150 RepID=UPI0023E332BB|nr:rhomboid family intramembrane serine protease [Flavipsychrobacter sp. JY13-12]
MLTIIIIIITAITSFSAFNNEVVFEKLCLYPYQMNQTKKEYFRFVSVGFVHADFGHLLFNMLTLYFFGTELENHIFSTSQYLLFYTSALVLSCVTEYSKQKDNPEYRACGASGAVAAIMFAQVLFQPWGVIYLKFIIPIYFILFAVGYLIYSYYMSHKTEQRIGHGIHLWGALYGIAYTLILKPESYSIFLDQVRNPPFLK